MANVALLGAVYADVPAVQVPADGGGVATFYEEKGSQTVTENGTYDVSGLAEMVVDVSGGASIDVEALSVTQNGTYTAPTGKAYSPVTVNVGGGGASNFVMGKFTGTTPGAAMDIDLPYTGDGYPIAVMVFPSEGSYHSGGTFFTLVERYAIDTFVGVKNDPGTASTYVSSSSYKSQNAFVTTVRYKSSTSNSASFSSSASNQVIITSGEAATSPGGTPSAPLRFKDKKTLSVYIGGSNYHFAANIEYTYLVVYSE